MLTPAVKMLGWGLCLHGVWGWRPDCASCRAQITHCTFLVPHEEVLLCLSFQNGLVIYLWTLPICLLLGLVSLARVLHHA